MARGRSSTGLVVAVVLFAMLFVLTTVVAIIFYTEKEEIIVKQRSAEADLLVYRTGAEHANDEIKALRDQVSQKSADSVVTVLREDRKWLVDQIDPDRNTRAGVESSLKAALGKLGKDSNPGLLNLITDLVSDVDQFRNRAAAAETKVTQEAEKAKDYEAQINALSAKYQKDVSDLKAQLAAIESDNQAAQANSQQQFQAVEITTKESAAKAQAEIARLEKELIVKQARIGDLEIAIAKLQDSKIKRGDGPDPSLEPDGRILSSIPESEIVTINLAKNDKLYLGLTFEVFDKKQGIGSMEFGQLRGKATIEVAKVKENTTECRVVRKDRNATIFEGDIIANVVYDKHRTYTFHVFGDFDIDGDLRATASEQRRIKSMIEQWGGKVAKEMSYDVDFLVLGQLPVVPVKIDETDPRQIEAKAAAERKLTQYRQLEGEARTFRMPILNQNRFLMLVGYYDRNKQENPFKVPDSQNSALLREAASSDDLP